VQERDNMHRLGFGVTVGVLLVLTAGRWCGAAPTGMNVIPTADLLGHSEVALEYQNDGVRPFRSDCNQWTLFQLGLFDRLELGMDRCLDGETGILGNAKLLLRQEGAGPAIALGVQNVGRDAEAQPYLALAREAGVARVHLGAIRIDGDAEAMLGIERPLTAGLTLLVDHVTGSERVTGIGLAADLPLGISASLARLVTSDPEGEDTWQLIVSGAPAIRF